MSLLAAQQNALVSALFSWPAEQAIQNLAAYAELSPASAAIAQQEQQALQDRQAPPSQPGQPSLRGLRAYQANGHALAERALLAAYPVLAQLLGGDSFATLARALWHAHPPVRGDLAQWGDSLADLLTDNPQLQDEPYLADVARLEWALHQCAGSADRTPQPASLELLVQHDPAQIRLLLAPGCCVVPSTWPVVSIVNAHGMATPLFAQVGQKLRAAEAETALVWRQQLQPRCRETVRGEAGLMAALLAGATLGQALDSAPALDVTAWLPMAVQTGLVLGANHTISVKSLL